MGIRSVAIAAACAGLLSGCASNNLRAGENTDAVHGDEPALTAALRLWADFPVDSTPRPLVLTGPAINDPGSGFSTGDDKIAYISGSFELATALPTEPSQENGQTIITAAEAFADLQAHGDGSGVSSSLKVTDVSLGTGSFSTDRGQQHLPAWIFNLARVADPVGVLAVPPASRWPKSEPARDTSQLGSFTIAPDGHRITVTFTGAAPGSGPCQAEYAADTAESSTAVAVSIRQLPNSDSSTSIACAAIGYPRTVTVDLTTDLGHRVLLDAQGAPVPER